MKCFSTVSNSVHNQEKLVFLFQTSKTFILLLKLHFVLKRPINLLATQFLRWKLPTPINTIIFTHLRGTFMSVERRDGEKTRN